MADAHIPPRTLLAIDAVGAGASMVMLGVVLRTLAPVTGLPADALTMLATLPVICIGYDLACLVTRRADQPSALWTIALMNALYSLVSAAVLIVYAGQVTPAGWIYFVAEIVIVLVLATVQSWRARLRE